MIRALRHMLTALAAMIPCRVEVQPAYAYATLGGRL